MSANSAVMVLRSPERTSAASGASRTAGSWSVEGLASLTFAEEADSGAAHCPQNLWPGGFSKPHFGHAAASGAAHSPQNFMIGWLANPHSEQRIPLPCGIF